MQIFPEAVATTVTTKTAAATSTTALTTGDSGKLILMAPNAAAITLPVATAGVNYNIVQTGDYATAVCTLTQAASGHDFFGVIVSGEMDSGSVTDIPVAANTKIQFGSGAKKGDRAELISDGSGWFVRAYCRLAAGITFET